MLLRDLKDPRLMILKAGLFLGIGIMSAALLIAQNASLRTALLLGLSIWSFARLYYFAFYVIERYVDPSFRFAGLGSFILYLAKHRAHPDHQKREQDRCDENQKSGC